MRTVARSGVFAALAGLVGCGGEVTSGGGTDAANLVDTATAETGSGTDTGVVTELDAGPVATDAGPAPMEDVRTFMPDAQSPQTAIEAPADAWTWVPFPDSACGNGTPAGIGVNLHPGSRRVVVFFMGGGGCWDAFTCLGIGTADHIRETYTSAMMQREVAGISQTFLFNRANTDNPMREANYVFVPYCTGDIHGGDRVVDYRWGSAMQTTHHVGARNVDAYLRRLVRTIPNADRVLVTGVSAGGFGAGIHWSRVADAWPSARVDLIDDSGPPITPPATRWAQWRAAWNLQIPTGCTTCSTELESLIAFYGRRFPSPSRMALLSYLQDGTISTFYGVSGPMFETGLRNLATTQFMGRDNARYFFLPGNRHVLLGNAAARGADGTTLAQFLTQMLTDSPDWHNVAP